MKRKSKNKNFLHNEYLLAFNFLKKCKNQIYFMIGIFIIFSIIGFFIPLPEDTINQLMDYFKELVLSTENFGFLEMLWFLFKNNIWASFFAFAGGIFLGIVPIFNSIANGFVLGFASRVSVSSAGILSLWRLLPHGIFELPALFISLGIGLKLGMSVILEKESIKETFFNSLRVFLLIVLPLLIIAGIIEAALIIFL